jgi:hypothetical protein
MDSDPRRAFLNNMFRSGLAVALSRFALLAPLAPLTHGIQGFGSVPRKLADNKSIFELRGSVLVNGTDATLDTFIKADALIETKSNSYIIFKVGKDAHILRENSKMQLQGSNTVEVGLNLLTGKILSVFGERGQTKKHTLRTSTATIGIRGTGVYAESYPDSSYLCTCYGQTIIEANEDLGKTEKQYEEIESSHHDAPRFILKNPEDNKLIIPAPVFNHTDEELILIEAIVGRESPISAIQSYSSPRRGY